MFPASHEFNHEQVFTMHRGGRLPGLRLVYETWGELNEARDNALLLFTGLSPSAHAAASSEDPEPGWWEPMVGAGKPLDSDRLFIICVNSLGSCWGSSGPASPHPEDGKPWRLRFPELSIEDVATSAELLLDHLGIGQLHAVVGPSMGGLSALAFVSQFPGRTRHLLLLSTALRSEPQAIAIRSVQREAICTDPNWNKGQYNRDHWPGNGMRLARKMGMISYRSAAEWRVRFGRELQDQFPRTTWGMNYEVESYLEAAARRFVDAFDPACYVYLSRAMDWFGLGDNGEDAGALLANSGLSSACVIGVESDALFPIHQQREIAELLQNQGVETRFHALPSVQGHDAFLVDYARFAPPVRAYLDNSLESPDNTGQ